MHWLGYAGLTPFAFFALGVWFFDDYLQALSHRGFVVYSLVILCFLAGSLWGTAMTYDGEAKIQRLVVSNGLAVFAALSVLTAQLLVASLLLMLGHLAVLWYERNTSRFWGWYGRLRTQLTSTAVLLHLVYATGVIARNGG
jgi:hypothetical protein